MFIEKLWKKVRGEILEKNVCRTTWNEVHKNGWENDQGE